jgi:hypothetical protein
MTGTPTPVSVGPEYCRDKGGISVFRFEFRLSEGTPVATLEGIRVHVASLSAAGLPYGGFYLYTDLHGKVEYLMGYEAIHISVDGATPDAQIAPTGCSGQIFVSVHR